MMHGSFNAFGSSCRSMLCLFLIVTLTSCGDAETTQSPSQAVIKAPLNFDTTCDNAVYPSSLWTRCELENVSKRLEAPLEQVTPPAFLTAVGVQSGRNVASYFSRILQDPSWLLLSLNGLDGRVQSLLEQPMGVLSINGNTPLTSVTSTYAGPAVSDPFRYPDAKGADGARFINRRPLLRPWFFMTASAPVSAA